ncbi:MAG: DUF4395 domain-containing protein [Pseudomonadota bacterium]
MNDSIFQFGQKVPGYDVPVLNERAARAGAGILFFFAIVAFMNAWLLGNFQPTRVFVIAFLVDFTIRIFINPAYAPSLVVGQWFVRRQQAEYVGAAQKRFAWAIGFVLALAMLYLVVINNMIGPINLIVCSLCLLLLFFETAFGICLGCMIYNLFHGKAELCPGGVCESSPAPGAAGRMSQWLVVAAFAVMIVMVAGWSAGRSKTAALPDASAVAAPADPVEAERCKVPDFAKAMGHEEKWKLHNNCQ